MNEVIYRFISISNLSIRLAALLDDGWEVIHAEASSGILSERHTGTKILFIFKKTT